MTLTPEQIRLLAKHVPASQLQEQAYKRRLYTDLAFFVQEAWSSLLPGTRYVHGWYIDVICKRLEKVARFETPRQLINIPPGHAKSTIVAVMYPAWVWLTRPHLSFMFSSYSLGLSQRDGEYTRTVVQSEWYQKQIPRRWGPNNNEPWKLIETAVTKLRTSGRGSRYATSVTGQSTGFRADFVVIDDAQKADEFVTPESQDKVISWYEKAISNRVNDEQSSSIICIQQRLAERDLAGFIIEKDRQEAETPGSSWTPYDKLILPTLFDPERASVGDIRTKKDELLFPERFPVKVIERAKSTLQEYGFSAQHQQDPVAAGAGVFDLTRLVFWYDTSRPVPRQHKEKDKDGNDVPCVQIPLLDENDRGWSNDLQSWDCSFKETAGSDFVCGQVWRLNKTRCFLLDQYHERAGFTETKRAIIEMSEKHPNVITKLIEDKANGSAIIDALKDTLFGIEAVNPIGGKLSRANAVAPLVSAGNVCLPHPEHFPWVHSLLKEMRGFPRAAHDDQIDAMTQALPRLIEGGTAWLEALCRLDFTGF